MNLTDFSTHQVFSFFIIFCRVGTAIIFMPSVGELFVPVRIKLIFSVLFTILLLPVIGVKLAIPQNPLELGLMIFSEITVGFLIGFTSRMVLAAINILGFTISYQTGLSAAMMLDPGQSTQGSLIGNFLGMSAIVLIIAADLHHDVLKVFIHSYNFISINEYGQYYNDFTGMITKNMVAIWDLGIRMSVPFLVVGILMNVGGAILSRLMPQLQIFFLFLPLQILLGIFLLGLTFSTLMLWFLDRYRDIVINFFS